MKKDSNRIESWNTGRQPRRSDRVNALRSSWRSVGSCRRLGAQVSCEPSRKAPFGSQGDGLLGSLGNAPPSPLYAGPGSGRFAHLDRTKTEPTRPDVCHGAQLS
ncbi:unnamed protein product [Durusdinium trenchii]|uniref:Uncharacterized protein n=1 Tax=Durusdinium trenchii TaxID=1381693 RepID=A0ABP0I9W1_9DINO